MKKGIIGVRELWECLTSIQISVYTHEMQYMHNQSWMMWNWNAYFNKWGCQIIDVMIKTTIRSIFLVDPTSRRLL